MAPHPQLDAATGSDGTPPGAEPAGQAIESLSAAWNPEGIAGALGNAGILIGVAVVAVLMHTLVFFLARRAARRTPFEGDEMLVAKLRGPTRVIVAVLAVQFTMPSVPMADAVRLPLRHALSLTLILAVTWLAIQLIRAGTQVVISRFDTGVEDNLEARKVHTQMRLLSRMFGIVAGVIGVGVALMTFPTIRQLGASILASAGIAGLIVGLAAQKVIANFLAGLQIVFAGPIHLDDVVVIDGEWGRIEEITTTYVVVRIWDERRLIVPFSRFLDEPFANWTRSRSEVLGTVYLHADYTVPVDALREETKRIVEASPHWDKRAWGLVVTDATSDTVELRALMSARNGSKAWDLRCEVREKLIGFLQREHPHCLPRTRITLDERGGDEAPEADAVPPPSG